MFCPSFYHSELLSSITGMNINFHLNVRPPLTTFIALFFFRFFIGCLVNRRQLDESTERVQSVFLPDNMAKRPVYRRCTWCLIGASCRPSVTCTWCRRSCGRLRGSPRRWHKGALTCLLERNAQVKVLHLFPLREVTELQHPHWENFIKPDFLTELNNSATYLLPFIFSLTKKKKPEKLNK